MRLVIRTGVSSTRPEQLSGYEFILSLDTHVNIEKDKWAALVIDIIDFQEEGPDRHLNS